MFNNDYIALRLVRVRPAEHWDRTGAGLDFVFPKHGAGEYISSAGRHRFNPGDVLVVNLARGGTVTPTNGHDAAFWHFSIAVEQMFPLFASDEICLLTDVVERLKIAKVYPASSALATACHRLLEDVPPSLNLDHRSRLLGIVATILSEEFKSALMRRGGIHRPEDHMTRVFENLSSQELLRLSVTDLARKFSCSRRHLNRLFHQHFGVSVASLRMEMRLTKAASLLRDPNTKVIRVAEECGFNHLGLFNTCFKRRFGLSPGQWRKNASAGAHRSAQSPEVCPLQSGGVCPWRTGSRHDTERQPVMGSGRSRPARVLTVIDEDEGQLDPKVLSSGNPNPSELRFGGNRA